MTRPLEIVAGAMLPAPPYPPDTRNRGWHFLLDVHRMRQSDTWALCAAEFRPWLLWLWVKSWEEIPVGSYPNDDAIIAAKIGMTLELFDGHRAMLMRGWYRASDNRLYHPHITELVRGRIAWKDAERARKAAYREKMSHDVPRDTSGQTRDGDDTGAGAGAGAGAVAFDVELPETSHGGGVRGGGLLAVPARRRTHTPKKIGTRLPDDWTIPDDWVEWAERAYPVDRTRVIRLSLEFRDYWIAVPGAKGIKLDWLATWRNNCRRKLENV